MNKKISTLVVIAALSGVAGCERAHRPEGAVELKMPQGTPKRPQGVEGLAVKPGPEPFTKDEVASFLKTHRLARTVGDISQLKVESVEFITSKQVASRLRGASTGLPDDYRVAFVTISGPIYFTTPLSKKRPVAFDTAYAMFDAGSGNLLMSGTLAKSKTQPQGGGNDPGGRGNQIN